MASGGGGTGGESKECNVYTTRSVVVAVVASVLRSWLVVASVLWSWLSHRCCGRGRRISVAVMVIASVSRSWLWYRCWCRRCRIGVAVSSSLRRCRRLHHRVLIAVTVVVVIIHRHGRRLVRIHPASSCSQQCRREPVVEAEVGQGVAVVPPLPGDMEGTHPASSYSRAWASSRREHPASSFLRRCHRGPVVAAEGGQGLAVSHPVAPASRRTRNCELPRVQELHYWGLGLGAIHPTSSCSWAWPVGSVREVALL
jgi:hypothetical protein